MLHSFRQGSAGLAAKIMIGFLVLSFAVWGVEDMIKGHGASKTVATVGNTSISAADYARALRREQENLRERLGSAATPEVMRMIGLEHQVLNRMINRELLKLETRALGLLPGDAAVAERIRRDAMFKDSRGAFDKARFQQFLRATNISEKAYVEELRTDIAIDLLMDALSANAPVHAKQAETLAAMASETRMAEVYVIPPSLAAAPALSKEEMEAYFEKHKERYQRPETRRVTYVRLAASAPAPTEDALKAAYESRKAEFTHPERRELEQWLFEGEAAAKEAAARLQQGASDETVAKLGGSKVPSGLVEKARLPESAQEAVFALKESGYSAPVQTPFGWHVFHVLRIVPAGTVTFEAARPQLEKTLKEEADNAAQRALADKLEDALAGGATLAEAARSLELAPVQTDAFDRQGLTPEGTKAARLPEGEAFLTRAFSTEAGRDSGVFAGETGAYLLLQVDEVTPATPRPFAEVEKDVAASWAAERGKEALRTLADEIAAGLKNPETRRETIRRHRLTPVSLTFAQGKEVRIGQESAPAMLAGELSRLSEGQATGAYALGESYAVAVLASKQAARATPEQVTQTRGALAQQAQGELLQQYVDYLREKYAVTAELPASVDTETAAP